MDMESKSVEKFSCAGTHSLASQLTTSAVRSTIKEQTTNKQTNKQVLL